MAPVSTHTTVRGVDGSVLKSSRLRLLLCGALALAHMGTLLPTSRPLAGDSVPKLRPRHRLSLGGPELYRAIWGLSQCLAALWGPCLSLFPPSHWPLGLPALGPRGEVVLKQGTGFRAYTAQRARQGPDGTGSICLLKNRISFYVQICIYLHRMYTQESKPEVQAWLGSSGWASLLWAIHPAHPRPRGVWARIRLRALGWAGRTQTPSRPRLHPEELPEKP